jgi:hypothetical protein
MAFVIGIANNQTQLKDALVTACTANGWTFTGTVLHRGNVFVQLSHKATTGWDNQFLGQLGKGMAGDGSALVDPVGFPVCGGGSAVLKPVYPVNYDIHIFDNEVFMIWWDNTDRHFWIAFGQSSPYTAAPAAGASLWIGATHTDQVEWEMGIGVVGDETRPIAIGHDFGGSTNIDYNSTTSAALFWWSTLSNWYGDGYGGGSPTFTDLGINMTNTQFTDRAGDPFGGNTQVITSEEVGFPPITIPAGTYCAPQIQKPLMDRARNTLANETVMLPIAGGHYDGPGQFFENRHVEIEVQNARYFRLGNNAPRDIITVGKTRYKVYPWYKRDAASHGGGNRVNHTGTFGWAIKYTGA